MTEKGIACNKIEDYFEEDREFYQKACDVSDKGSGDDVDRLGEKR